MYKVSLFSHRWLKLPLFDCENWICEIPLKCPNNQCPKTKYTPMNLLLQEVYGEAEPQILLPCSVIHWTLSILESVLRGNRQALFYIIFQSIQLFSVALNSHDPSTNLKCSILVWSALQEHKTDGRWKVDDASKL